jgi:putative membrane protein insertion efficiency factor
MVGRFLIWLIGLYQGTSSVRRARCRYIPTCSHYAVEAIEKHGTARGSWLAVKRLARCQPFGSHGFDPVPDPER